jgi:ATPase family AAA domain-containing protein 3A/B
MNYLFYGPPRTGKTAMARALAYESGMDFAFMTGASVFDLLRLGRAIKRLKEVFDWAKPSKKGLILFIDEADAFLGDPNGAMSKELNSVLKAFLNYTGTESKNFSLILSTNHPNQLSKAVLSRVGYRQQLYFGAPSLEAREKIINHCVDKYLSTSTFAQESVAIDEQLIREIAQKTQGFVGCDLSYLVLGIEKAAMASEAPVLDRNLIENVINQAVNGYHQTQHFQSHG